MNVLCYELAVDELAQYFKGLLMADVILLAPTGGSSNTCTFLRYKNCFMPIHLFGMCDLQRQDILIHIYLEFFKN